MSADADVLVVGAGIAGLAAARELERRGRRPLLVDARAEVGGVMRTREVAGHRVELGPNTFRLTPPLRAGLERFGLGEAPLVATPASRIRWIARGDRLCPAPLGPLGLLRSPLLSWRGKLRLLAEPWAPRGDGARESVAAFVERRLGGEVLRGLVAPFLTGVYAGDESRLGAEAVFPYLIELEREHGSLAVGLLRAALRRGERATPGTFSHARGLGGLAQALAAGLREPPRTATRVADLRREGAAFRFTLCGGDGSSVPARARAVVLATPAREAAALCEAIDREAAAAFDSIAYAPLVALALGAPAAALARPPRGFGFLVPREAGASLLGCLFMSQLFPGRAPPGRELLHCMLGGVRWPDALSQDDAALRDAALRDLDRWLGVRGEIDVLHVERWPRAVPQPGIGHRALVRDARTRLAARGPIVVAGGYADGVGLPDAFASGVAAARALAGGG